MKLPLVAALALASAASFAVACSSGDDTSPSSDAGPDVTQAPDGGHDSSAPDANAQAPDSGGDSTAPDAGGDAPSTSDGGLDAQDSSADAAPDGGEPDGGACDVDAEATPNLGGNQCTAAQEQTAWTAMDSQPILLVPSRAAGLNLGRAVAQVDAGFFGIDDAGAPLTVDEAVQTNCQLQSIGDVNGTCVDWSAYWGSNSEVIAELDVATRQIYYLGLENGYVGKLSFKSADATNSYSIMINEPIMKNSTALTLDWTNTTALAATADELYRALLATFAPSLSVSATNCQTSGDCAINTFSDGSGYVYYPRLAFAFRVQSTTAAQPTPSTVYFIDLYTP